MSTGASGLVATSDRDPGRLGDPLWRATATAGLALLGALAVALTAHDRAALALAAAGALIALAVLAPAAAAALRRRPLLAVPAALTALVVVAGVLGLLDVLLHGASPGSASLLWTFTNAQLLTLAVMTLAATFGVVLIADALRGGLRRAGAGQAPWEQLTAPAANRPRRGIAWGAVAGVLLVGWAAVLAVGLVGPYVAGNGWLLVVVVLVGLAAAIVVATPLTIARLARADRKRADDAVEEERRRFAAHLHDSVLQTLALVQRQAHDPAAVARLARRQEHALRAWMAGESELASQTLVAALRDAATEIEDDEGVTVQLTAIGDRALDAPGEALVAAAREALRNAARHGGAPIVVFVEVTPAGVEAFVRDEGGGFDPAAVAPERRGIRDAIVGRMEVAGGSATVDSVSGEGTEVALRFANGGGGARR